VEWVTQYIAEFNYFAVALVLFAAGLGFPIPEDIPLIYGGVMASMDPPLMDPWIHGIVSITFILIGDYCLYRIGRKIGDSAEAPGFARKVFTPKAKAKVNGMFERYGAWAVFFGRFIAGVRAVVFLTAGMSRFPVWKFLLLDFLAALLSVPVWIYLGLWAGQNWEYFLEQAKIYNMWLIGGLAVAGLIGYLVVKARNRRNTEPEETIE
jgi:membrane protein DedA with SNARE-associated domain